MFEVSRYAYNASVERGEDRLLVEEVAVDEENLAEASGESELFV